MLAEAGSDADIKKMRKILNEDPKRFIYFFFMLRFVRSIDDPENLVNRKNKKG